MFRYPFTLSRFNSLKLINFFKSKAVKSTLEIISEIDCQYYFLLDVYLHIHGILENSSISPPPPKKKSATADQAAAVMNTNSICGFV